MAHDIDFKIHGDDMQTLPFSRRTDRIVNASGWAGRKEESSGIGGLPGGMIRGRE